MVREKWVKIPVCACYWEVETLELGTSLGKVAKPREKKSFGERGIISFVWWELKIKEF